MLVERGPVRRGDHGTGSGASVAGVPLGAASGDGVDDLNCGIYPADASVMGVGNEQVALAITRNSHGVRGEGRFGRGAAVSGVARPSSSDGGDDAGGQVDPANAAVAYVGEIYGVVDEHGRSISLGGGITERRVEVLMTTGNENRGERLDTDPSELVLYVRTLH